MVSKNGDKYVVWSIYFDKSISRIKGRKISNKNAKEKPSLDDIFKVCKSLGLNPILEKNKSHPSLHWKKDGRILIDRKGPKNKVLKLPPL